MKLMKLFRSVYRGNNSRLDEMLPTRH